MMMTVRSPNHDISFIRTKNPECTPEESLTAVNFASPLRDVAPPPPAATTSTVTRPVPAPRLSKLPSMASTTTELSACDEQGR